MDGLGAQQPNSPSEGVNLWSPVGGGTQMWPQKAAASSDQQASAPGASSAIDLYPAWSSPEMFAAIFAELAIVVVAFGVAMLLHKTGIVKGALPFLAWAGLTGLMAAALPYWRKRERCTITPQGIYYSAGFPIRLSSTQIGWHAVTQIEVDQGLFERLVLRTGDILIYAGGVNIARPLGAKRRGGLLPGTYSSDMGPGLFIRGVKNPYRVQALIQQMAQAGYRGGYGAQGGGFFGNQ